VTKKESEVVKMENEKKACHPKYELPSDPHAKYRYEAAVKHAKLAHEAGKSSEEVHAMFHKIMNRDINDLDSLPTDEAHKLYRSAVIHAKKAMEAGKSSEEVHEIFQKVLKSDGQGHCHGKC